MVVGVGDEMDKIGVRSEDGGLCFDKVTGDMEVVVAVNGAVVAVFCTADAEVSPMAPPGILKGSKGFKGAGVEDGSFEVSGRANASPRSDRLNIHTDHPVLVLLISTMTPSTARRQKGTQSVAQHISIIQSTAPPDGPLGYEEHVSKREVKEGRMLNLIDLQASPIHLKDYVVDGDGKERRRFNGESRGITLHIRL